MGEVLQRGRLYERYSEMREAKLREEWFLRMQQKEAEMRAMWNRLDSATALSSRPENSQSFDVHLDSHTRQKVCSRPEKSQPFDVHSDSHTRQKMTKSAYKEEKTKTTTSRNNSKNRSALDRSSYSMPLIAKENRAPISKEGLTVTASSSMSSQKILSRSRTTNEEQKKGMPVKSHHRRNTLAGPMEFRGLELDKSFYSESSSPRKSSVSKPFLKKGRGIGPGAGAAIAKHRRSISISSEQRGADCLLDSGDSSSSQELQNEFLVPSGTSLTSSGSESVDSISNLEVRDAKERKKWGTPAKPTIFSNDSQKDSPRGLKKLLLNIVGKTKIRESSMYDSSSVKIGK